MAPTARAPRLPRSWRRFPVVTVLVVGWLCGGLLSAAVAAVVDYPADHLYALAQTSAAALALALLTVVGAGRRPAGRRPAVRRPAVRRTGAVDATARATPGPSPVAVPEPRLPQRAEPVGAASATSRRTP